ncbi:hypothetical protein [Virgibacillus halodenitrificans]|uniref:hypothetical protein n=1 Tax=Virgibacillus halodenitrificans TaxID=1482 RepID=UPI0003090601|nr:hypothetical protein [Virgibacillus halodenitrificans]
MRKIGLRQKVNKYFGNQAETRENHWDPSLQTHYYKITKDKGFQYLVDFFEKSSVYEVHAMSKEHGEISLQVKKGRNAFIVATVIMVRPYYTAIDFSVTTESFLPIDFGYSSKIIYTLYNDINKELTLIT